jgi:DnaJ-domain-containing protein 1
MSIPDRLWRIARFRVRDSLGLVQGAAFKARRSARQELEEALRDLPLQPRASTPPRSPATPPPPHPYTREYRLLGAPVGAGLDTVRQYWRQKVRETHPDRFATAEDKEQAAGRLRRINEAYRALRAHLKG